MNTLTVQRYENDDALAGIVAALWSVQLKADRDAGIVTYVALPGGRIAQKVFATTAQYAAARPEPFFRAHYFWSDERCVPPVLPDSNFALAREHFFQPLQIPKTQIHRIRGEVPQDEAARLAEEEVRNIVPLTPDGVPMFDLTILSMGEDGHIASLFPGSESAPEQEGRVYIPVTGPKPPPQRVTMSYQALAASRLLWVLASGVGKEAALVESLKPDGKTPLAHLLRKRARRTWIFTDIKAPPVAPAS